MVVEDAFPSCFLLPPSYHSGLLEEHLCRPSPGVFSRNSETVLIATLETLAGLVSGLHG